MTVYEAARAAGAFANRKILALQGSFLKEGSASSAARATLAQLRNLGTPGRGSWIQVGALLFEGMPDADLTERDRERMVNAVSCALSLYARHQQAKDNPMALIPPKAAERGSGARRGFGWSCRQIERDLDQSQGVRRRIQGLEATSDFSGVAYHLRGLIDLMKAKDVPVDYGLLARDLYLVQFPGIRDRVFMDWAREYYKMQVDDDGEQVSHSVDEGDQVVENER